jgi:hypothetical protein
LVLAIYLPERQPGSLFGLKPISLLSYPRPEGRGKKQNLIRHYMVLRPGLNAPLSFQSDPTLAIYLPELQPGSLFGLKPISLLSYPRPEGRGKKQNLIRHYMVLRPGLNAPLSFQSDPTLAIYLPVLQPGSQFGLKPISLLSYPRPEGRGKKQNLIRHYMVLRPGLNAPLSFQSDPTLAIYLPLLQPGSQFGLKPISLLSYPRPEGRGKKQNLIRHYMVLRPGLNAPLSFQSDPTLAIYLPLLQPGSLLG